MVLCPPEGSWKSFPFGICERGSNRRNGCAQKGGFDLIAGESFNQAGTDQAYGIRKPDMNHR